MKTVRTFALADSMELESVREGKGYVVTRLGKEPDSKVQYWEQGASGWVNAFTVECLFPSPAAAHKIIEALPAGGDPNYDFEVVPVTLTPARNE